MPRSERFVTGDKQLDKALRGLEPRLQKKYLRKATRNAAKRTQREAQANVPEDTQALRDSMKVRAVKRSRGRVGHMVHIDRDQLITERAARGGRAGQDKKRGEPFFYAAVVELDPGGNKPLRSALYDNARETQQEVIHQLRRFILGVGRDGKRANFFRDDRGVVRSRDGRIVSKARAAELDAAGLIGA